jgi:hypothetical protein
MLGIPFHQIKSVDPSLLIVAALGRQVEMPLLTVGQYGKLNATVEGILKKLFVRSTALTNLFDLNKNKRFFGRMAKGEVHPSALDRVFRPSDLRIEYGPSEGVEYFQDDRAVYGSLIGQAALPERSTYLLDHFLNSSRV